MRKLDQRKLEKLSDYINNYIQRHNRAPKFSEILGHMEMTKSVGYRYLLKLKDLGIIEYDGKGTLWLKGKEHNLYNSQNIDIIGSIICGNPEDEHEYIEGYLSIPNEWLDGDCYLLRARGDSMIGAGIDEGDLLLIKRTNHCEEKQIVVALTENGNTLKRFVFKDNKPCLFAENPNYDDTNRIIFPKKLEIQGVALKLIKNL